jgi:hypothetical protein
MEIEHCVVLVGILLATGDAMGIRVAIVVLANGQIQSLMSAWPLANRGSLFPIPEALPQATVMDGRWPKFTGGWPVLP